MCRRWILVDDVGTVPSDSGRKGYGMRFLRFSIKRLLILVAVVAVLIYALVLRPTVIAKQMIHEAETATDLKAISDRYFDGMDADNARAEGELGQRTWADIFTCRQSFVIRMTRPMPTNKEQLIVSNHDCYATPL